MTRPRWLTTLMLLLLVGCDEPGSEETPPQLVATDSAGVRLVDNGAVDPRAAGFALDSVPLFRVGWSEHPDSLQFSRMWQGAILKSGDFAVADLAEVHVLRPDGSVVYSVGGPGRGPGEFESIWRLVPGPGDTLIVHDWGRGRVATFVGPELVSDVRLPDHDRIDRNVVQGAYDGALILLPTGYHFVDGPTTEWYDAPVLRMADGVVDTLVSLAFARKGRGHVLSPFGWTRVSGDRLVHARGDEHVVRWYTFGGELAQVSRWTSPRIAATDPVWARLSEELREAGRYAEMPAHLPTYANLHGDPLGGVWLGEFTLSSVLPTHHLYLDPEGVAQGALEVPDGFEVLAFGEGVVLGVERNEFDVPAAVAYRFSRVR